MGRWKSIAKIAINQHPAEFKNLRDVFMNYAFRWRNFRSVSLGIMRDHSGCVLVMFSEGIGDVVLPKRLNDIPFVIMR